MQASPSKIVALLAKNLFIHPFEGTCCASQSGQHALRQRCRRGDRHYSTTRCLCATQHGCGWFLFLTARATARPGSIDLAEIADMFRNIPAFHAAHDRSRRRLAINCLLIKEERPTPMRASQRWAHYCKSTPLSVFFANDDGNRRFTKYNGRRFASLKIRPTYSPTMPIDMSCTPPRNKITAINEG